jgi:DNA helicase-2/ATP-dependent DNA helicase PcrA
MDVVHGLNPQQQQAVTAPDGAVLVLAGPGSGKTRVLTHRIAYLIQHQGVAPWRIMAVTFTNKAAREMTDRVAGLLGGRPDGLTLGTFHACCARILRREAEHLDRTSSYVIYDTDDQESLVRRALKKLNLDDKKYPPRQMLQRIDRYKNELIKPDTVQPGSYLEEIAARVYEQYEQLLQESNAYDFGDLLMQVVLLLDSVPAVMQAYQQRYRHVLVDEFQDTNTAQYALVKRLAAEHGNLFVVGDEDQSIYLFRGADWRNVRRFRDDFPECQTILLEQNYRSTQIILDAAQAVIQRNPHRTHKRLFTERQGGGQITVEEAHNEDEEAQMVVDTIRRLAHSNEARPGDVAIMYRINAQSRRIEEALMRSGMPYRLVGALRFYGRREVKDVIAFLHLVQNPADSVSLLRVINVPSRGIGARTIASLENWAAALNRSPGDALTHMTDGSDVGAGRFPGSNTAHVALSRFAALLAGWVARSEILPVADLMDVILEESGYQRHLQDGTTEGQERWENVQELRRVAAEFPDLNLTDFLEQVSLVSDVDKLTDEVNAPTLLTLHAAKGLEFPIVFIVGLEDGILPHRHSWEEPDQMWEERRLFYVGITRAKSRLFLFHCFRRSLWGSTEYTQPSRFLEDIPPALIVGRSPGVGIDRPSRTDWSWSRSGGVLPEPAELSRSDRAVQRSAAGAIYMTGQRVRHPQFGEGIVIESQPADGDSVVTVAFSGLGLKRLMGSMAKLETLPDSR